MRSEWTILVDSREQKPLPFPRHLVVGDRRGSITTVRLNTLTTTLPTGDYALQGFESAVLIERKGSMRELHQNLLTPDRTRFEACLTRLQSACRWPILLFEGDVSPSRHEGPPLSMIRDALLDIVRCYTPIELMVFPHTSASSRRLCGEWVAAALIAGALRWQQRPGTDSATEIRNSIPLSPVASAPPSPSST